MLKFVFNSRKALFIMQGSFSCPPQGPKARQSLILAVAKSAAFVFHFRRSGLVSRFPFSGWHAFFLFALRLTVIYSRTQSDKVTVAGFVFLRLFPWLRGGAVIAR
ncbi:hypothetical protein MAF45_01680 [Mesosutterella sp. OilRF-GAM-744-9]|uniref:Uncharacterized protein n=1 Tax=Mesosutterella porci TaxID=2915351 RepID=A0ABS9MNR0_9BURK|nr:hypothetical protein [Mesosutterella sp. oilRF-744-WT-GAM-9]MCG5030167.1 hypothetical protein [Mesosutterella sp. oilRF-744-WT-GAM-9]